MSSPEEIQHEIDQTRDELRADMQALQERVDLKQKANEAVDRVTAMTREQPWRAGAAAFAVGWAAAWLITR
jgi:ElaB/YqjD/DUF883 family membrane-anchored ribosome-binding protein